MYVDRHMSSPAVTIGEDTTLADARSILEEHGFRHLPVIDGEGSLRGIVTDRDIRSALPSRIGGAVNDEALLQRLGGTPVKEIMTPAPHSLTLSSTLDDALFVLEREKIGALPVVDGEGRVAGILSLQDLLKAYKELFGLGGPGTALVEIEDDGSPGLLSRVVRILEERKISFSRLLRVGGAPGEGKGIVYLRVSTYNTHALHTALEAAGATCRLDTPRERAEGGKGKAGE